MMDSTCETICLGIAYMGGVIKFQEDQDERKRKGEELLEK